MQIYSVYLHTFYVLKVTTDDNRITNNDNYKNINTYFNIVLLIRASGYVTIAKVRLLSFRASYQSKVHWFEFGF